ncbi:MAG: response regulator [Ignavibacteriae bacterium]|nr:response regulator [Ignavibacteriota bacterium]
MITEKILVVDDEEHVCRSVKKILSRKGYTVVDAMNVEEAIRKINETSFDLVITDLMMPKTSGMELLQIIRDDYPELDVMMITGYASIDSAVKATKLGATGYLAKPFTPDELTVATEKAIAARKHKQTSEPKAKVATDESTDDIIDVDMPFNANELRHATSDDYVEALTHSDVPIAKKIADKAYCHTGKRDCRKVVKDGKECAGECPIEKKEKARAAKSATRVTRHSTEWIDVDMPFVIGEVEKVTGPEYIACLNRSDIPRAALYARNMLAKHTVLVIDDEPIVCHSVRKILSKQSCAVEEAFDVDVAMRKMKLNKYDMVILDLKMPKRSGIEVLRSIRELYPDLPVVMVSGYASIENAIEATRLGAVNFIPKPFTPDELAKVSVEALAA